MSGPVQCATHGPQRAAFICHHLLDSMQDGVARGLYWHEDDAGEINAWCVECENYRLEIGGDWTDESDAFTQIKLICAACFERLKGLNGFGGIH